ncbi:MAG: sigma-70 family RNA polymerase sigma factor [Bacteroidota bacterium]
MGKTFYQNEEELLAAMRQQDSIALNIIYKTYFPMILHFVSNNNGTEQEAKDIYQEGIIVLYENVQQSTFVLSCKIKTYLYSVCRRLWLKRIAEKGKYLGRIEDFENFIALEDDQAEMDEKETQYKVMRQALDQLGEPCRTIMEDFFVHNLSMQQITDKMGYTNADNAKNQKYKCLMRLKKLFFNSYRDE